MGRENIQLGKARYAGTRGQWWLGAVASMLAQSMATLIKDALDLYWFALPMLYRYRMSQSALSFIRKSLGKNVNYADATVLRRGLEEAGPTENYLKALAIRRWGRLQEPLPRAADLFVTLEQRATAEAFWEEREVDTTVKNIASHADSFMRRDAESTFHEEKERLLATVSLLNAAGIRYSEDQFWSIETRQAMVDEALRKFDRLRGSAR